MGTPPPTPPVVTKVSPLGGEVTDYAGSSRVFQVSIEPAAIVKVYFDGSLLSETSIATTSHSHTFPSAPVGEHVVRFVATIGDATGEAYWNWNVITSSETSPVVTLVSPSEQEIEDSGSLTTRTFEVSVNQPSRVRYYLNGDLEYDSESPVSTCSVTLTAPRYGQNIISVIAENSNGRGLNHWKWVLYSSVETPQPPVITLQWPLSETMRTAYGTSLPIYATIEPAAEVEIFFDETSVLSVEELTKFVIYSTSDSCSIGLHTIRIYAQNNTGSDEVIIYWTIEEEVNLPVLNVDLPPVISNLKGEHRWFTVTANTTCSVEFCIDGIPVDHSNLSLFSFAYFSYRTSKLSVGQHSVSFIAKNAAGQSEKSAIWIINDPTDFVQQVSGECEDADINGGLRIEAVLSERADGSRCIDINYTANVGMTAMDQGLVPIWATLKIDAAVSWPVITATGEVIDYPNLHKFHNTATGKGTIHLEVPTRSFYIVNVRMDGRYFAKEQEVLIPKFIMCTEECTLSLSLE
ncbi:MAG: hypothetical protein JW931_09925 [Methanomicrobiaceae archaeon]|nr:hypothetical protein [Methanomicrobiaceae archaeon]